MNKVRLAQASTIIRGWVHVNLKVVFVTVRRGGQDKTEVTEAMARKRQSVDAAE
jgi:hypothetical protein